MSILQTLFWLFGWAISWAISAWLLKMAIKILKEDIRFAAAFVIAAVSSIVSSVFHFFDMPIIGPALSWLISMVLLKMWSTVEDIWPTAVLVTLVYQLLNMVLVLALLSLV